MKNILIEVREKVASLKEGDSLICGNPYNITFDLDDEWADKLLRTARFVWRGKDGEPRFVDIPFSGDTVASPVLSDISQVFVGLYSGDLCTTTPALIPCQRSILCGGGIHEPPAEDVYNKIIELINSGAVKGEPGEKGEPGGPGPKGADGKDGVNGIDGKDGLNGKDGQDGYTPQKGVDYWTEAEKAEIVEQAKTGAIGDIETALDELHTYAQNLVGGGVEQ